MTSPSVSIVICTYNGAQYIREQLDSILAQTYPISEIVVQDDQSKDGTKEILEQYALNDSRIKIFTTTDRLGINNNFITAIDRATCDLIAWSDQDDIWRPDKIEKQVKALKEQDLWISFHITVPFKGDEVPKNPDYDKRMPNFGLERTLFLGSVPGHTMLFTKELRDKARNSVPDEKLRKIGESYYYDAMLSIVANAYGKVGCLVEPLDYHRRLITSVSESNRKNLSKRNLPNAIRKLIRNLKPEYRRVVKPLIEKRFDNMANLLGYFPDAPFSKDALKIISAYKKGYFFFITELIRNRDKIFFSKERSTIIASGRALFFPITMYDYFSISYKFAQNGAEEFKK